LELAVGGRAPRLRVALAALDVAPGVTPVERVEHRRARQAVNAVELARHVPPHVPEHPAEVEDDGAELTWGHSASSPCRTPSGPPSPGCASPRPPTAAPSRGRAGTARPRRHPWCTPSGRA